MRLFGTSEIRHIADNWLVQLTLKVGLAVGSVDNNVEVGTDTRTSSEALKYAFISGLTAGDSQWPRRVAPIPTIALAASPLHQPAGEAIDRARFVPVYTMQTPPSDYHQPPVAQNSPPAPIPPHVQAQ